MSPTPLSSIGPEGGTARSVTDVSSIPFAITEMWDSVPVPKLLDSVLPTKVAPVPYRKLLVLNGSTARAAVIQPIFGFSLGPEFPPPPLQTGATGNLSHGAMEMSCGYTIWYARLG